MDNKDKECNYVIELLRFLFCIMIVIHHSYRMYGDNKIYAPTGYMGVEFFFIITGYYMMKKIEKNNEKDIGVATKQYVLPKYKKLIVILFYSILASICFQTVLGGNADWKGALINSVPELLMLQMFGIGNYFPTGAAWYLSAMFLALTVLYPLALRYKSVYKNIIAPLISIVLLGYIIRSTGNIGNAPGQYLGFFQVGVWRAVADIAIGAVLYTSVKKLKNKQINSRIRWLLGGIEICGYIGVAYIAKTCQPGFTDFYFLVILYFSMVITLSEQSITYQFFNWKIWKKLGRFSSVWFLNNFYVAGFLPVVLPTMSGKRLLYTYIIISCIVSLLVLFAVQITNKIISKMCVLNKATQK